MRIRVLVVLVLVALAGCNAVIDDDGSDTPTLSPAPVPTTSDPPTETGLSTTGGVGPAAGMNISAVTDPGSLARQHVRTINDTSYVWTERYVEERREDNVTAQRSSTQRVTLEDASKYRHETATSETGDRRLRTAPYDHLVEGRVNYRDGYETYADGEVEFRSWSDFDGDGRIFTRNVEITDRAAFDTLARSPIERYLATNATTVMPVDGRGRWFEVTSSEPTVSLEPAPENYSARAIIRYDGFVRDLTVTYQRTVADRTISVRYSFRYDDVGTASVEPPEWLSEARAEFGESEG